MAGLAKTNNFLLSTATVMIGAEADLHDLNPLDHSLGLVKNFNINAEPTYTDLMQGVKGSIVFSTMTANPVRASMEVYEYTAKNLAYSLGLNGGSVTPATAQTTVGTAVPASPSQNTLMVVAATGLVAGDTILIERDSIDDFIIRKIVSVSTNTLTLDDDLPSISIGAKVYKVNAVDIGSKDDQPFFSAKIAGKLANGEAVVILIPKIRVIKGFNLGFITNDYANLPFEFQVYDLVSTDPMYAEYKNANARIFKRS